jgi:hypothetical protein
LGSTFVVAGSTLDTDDCAVVELWDGASTGVRARGTHTGDYLVDDVFDAGTNRVEIHSRGTDALLEQLFLCSLEG